MQLKICECECSFCGNVFYEWEDSCMEECPHCEADLSCVNSVHVVETQIVAVDLDVFSGRVKIAGPPE